MIIPLHAQCGEAHEAPDVEAVGGGVEAHIHTAAKGGRVAGAYAVGGEGSCERDTIVIAGGVEQ